MVTAERVPLDSQHRPLLSRKPEQNSLALTFSVVRLGSAHGLPCGDGIVELLFGATTEGLPQAFEYGASAMKPIGMGSKNGHLRRRAE